MDHKICIMIDNDICKIFMGIYRIFGSEPYVVAMVNYGPISTKFRMHYITGQYTIFVQGRYL